MPTELEELIFYWKDNYYRFIEGKDRPDPEHIRQTIERLEELKKIKESK
ncbi:unnamed protein product [marine sediment metagenome]|uniref:Uncharacterized protein n=1 Tax=marine sediment metagenome TaxID=412755 RepID=X1Q1G9_9ZZZZ